MELKHGPNLFKARSVWYSFLIITFLAVSILTGYLTSSLITGITFDLLPGLPVTISPNDHFQQVIVGLKICFSCLQDNYFWLERNWSCIWFVQSD